MYVFTLNCLQPCALLSIIFHSVLVCMLFEKKTGMGFFFPLNFSGSFKPNKVICEVMVTYPVRFTHKCEAELE